MSIERGKQTQLLLSQIDKLSLKLEERKIIEKAKRYSCKRKSYIGRRSLPNVAYVKYEQTRTYE